MEKYGEAGLDRHGGTLHDRGLQPDVQRYAQTTHPRGQISASRKRFLAKLRAKRSGVKLRPHEKYTIIKALNGDVCVLCELAQVSRSGYYRWLTHADELNKDYDNYLKVKEVFDLGKGRYGWRSIKMRLPEMNHKKIQRIMRKYDLVARVRRRNPYKAIMKKRLEHRIFPNKLLRAFGQNVPLKVFCTDITYIPFQNTYAYLSVVKDIASGEVVAWNLSNGLEEDLVLDTMRNMPRVREDAMIHSDQGFHYTNPQYIETVEGLGMIQSMSGKGKLYRQCADRIILWPHEGRTGLSILCHVRGTTFTSR